MIRNKLIHPQILQALAATGHKATVLITDGHYAARTTVGPHADTVHLNICAGTPTVTQLVDLVADAVAIEKATFIDPGPDAGPCQVQQDVRSRLGEINYALVQRSEFYRLARSEDLTLCIVTGDTRRFGNTLLTVGVTTA